jgi:ribosome-binding protein aMBF1 (putative translation factor)
MRKTTYFCDICGKEASRDRPVYNLIWQEQTDDGSDGDLDPVVEGVSTIDVCGVCALNVATTIRPVIGHMMQRTAENSSRKQQQKTAAENNSKPVANNNKPVKKVTAGSEKKKPGPPFKIDTGKLIALAKAGWTKEKIADELKVSVATVYGHLKKAREEGKI